MEMFPLISRVERSTTTDLSRNLTGLRFLVPKNLQARRDRRTAHGTQLFFPVPAELAAILKKNFWQLILSPHKHEN